MPRLHRLFLFRSCLGWVTVLSVSPLLQTIPAASSQRPQPLRILDQPTTLALEILPRPLDTRDSTSPSLRHSDHFRLTITAFSQQFHLHLRPNDDLIHSAARIRYYSTPTDGRPAVLRETVPILRHTVLAYVGDVVHGDRSDERMKEDASRVWRHSSDPHSLGWARIMVHHQGDAETSDEPIYEGAFMYHGDTYHIMRAEKYMRVKHKHDPQVDVDPSNPGLVIFRDTDLVETEPHFSKPKPSACGHDHLPFNSDPIMNPVLRVSPPWQSSMVDQFLENI